VRKSGTEPIIRIITEFKSKERVQETFETDGRNTVKCAALSGI